MFLCRRSPQLKLLFLIGINHSSFFNLRLGFHLFRVRFEKYVFSCRHILNESLGMKPTWDALSIKDASRGEVAEPYVSLIEEGIRDGVERLHVKASNSRLFFGMVSE